MSDTTENYEPFGDEWFMEVKKINKTRLVEKIRDVCVENIKLKRDLAASNSVGNQLAEHIDHKNDEISKLKKELSDIERGQPD